MIFLMLRFRGKLKNPTAEFSLYLFSELLRVNLVKLANFCQKENQTLPTSHNFLIPISLNPDSVNFEISNLFYYFPTEY